MVNLWKGGSRFEFLKAARNFHGENTVGKVH